MIKKICTYFYFLALFLGLCPIGYSQNTFGLIKKVYAQEKAKPATVKKESKEKKKNDDKGLDKNKKSKKEGEGLYDEYKAPQAEEVSYGWLFIKTLFVLGLFGVGFYFFFRFVTKKIGVPRIGTNIVQILSISPIGQGKFIQVVEIGGKILVLGVTDNSINLISEITEKDEIDRIKLNSSKSVPDKHTFQDFIKDRIGHFSEYLNKKSQKPKNNKMNKYNNPDDEIRLDYLKRQKDRLKKMNGFHDE